MAIKKSEKTLEGDLFRRKLCNLIDHRHELVKLTEKIDWASCEERFEGLYAKGVGRPGYPIRLMVGLQILKHVYNESDEQVVLKWVENPYWQYFCGMEYFTHELPIDPSLMTGCRKRIGSEGCECILGLTVRIAIQTETIKASDVKIVNVDTTVQPKAIKYPTDSALLQKVRAVLVARAQRVGIMLRQSYERVGAKAYAKASRYAHAKQTKRCQQQTKKLRTYLGRVIRDVERKIAPDADQQKSLEKLLMLAKRIHSQKRKRAEGEAPKCYSVHAPEVECISKGKTRQPYEFGVKVGVVTTNRSNFIIGMQAMPGNPYDGHTLEASLTQAQKMTGVAIEEVYVDRGYKGHQQNSTNLRVWITGAKRGVTETIKRKLKRRNAIEPVIGHMKNDGRLGRNYLQGTLGDSINAILLCKEQDLI